MREKITFILPNLLTGGTQRAIINIIQSLSQEKYDILLIVIHKEARDYSHLKTGVGLISNYDKKSIRTIWLNCSNVKWSILKIRKTLQQENPKILFSSLSYLNLYLGLLRFLLPKGIILVARETNILSVKHATVKFTKLVDLFYSLSYRFVDKFICQSKDMYTDLTLNYSVPRRKLFVINNPVNSKEVIEKSQINLQSSIMSNDYINLISVGHLTYQKGHDNLIKAIALLKNDLIMLHIVGRGPLLSNLKNLAKSLGVSNKVNFHGFKSNPYKYISRSDLFILPSRFEGFPNALIESGCIGVPMLANNCKGGINEIINKTNGMTYQHSAEDLANKINIMLKNIPKIEYS